ncbi:MAG: class I tRNA ligase family protein, partial [Saprospiraceae bacterium]|nr:class I tRNA ligase family protein [Saprospiraceae bacterium]
EDGISVFYSAELIDAEDEQFTKIPVHIDYVTDYGSPNSHLDGTGVVSFIEWRPEFAEARFVAKSGSWQKGEEVPAGFKMLTLSEVGKMSKRYFNVVNPDDIVAQYGADCFRMYEMFLGPIQQAKPWDTKGIDGVFKFLRRFWSLFEDEQGNWSADQSQPSESALKVLHQTIKKVREDVERFSFNTSVSAFMICVNELKKEECHSTQILEPLVRLIAPFAPHVAEELWHRLHASHSDGVSVHLTGLPQYDEQFLTESEVIYPVCINGKKRGELGLGIDVPQKEVEALVKDLEVVQKWTEGKPIRRIIVIPNKMINVVI